MPALFLSAYDCPLITKDQGTKAPRTARAINNQKKRSSLLFSLKTMVARQAQRRTLSLMAGRLHCPRQTTKDGMMACRGCIEAHHPMAITPLVVAAPSPLDHERTASIHCAATRENTECTTSASRATANADGHHATAPPPGDTASQEKQSTAASPSRSCHHRQH